MGNRSKRKNSEICDRFQALKYDLLLGVMVPFWQKSIWKEKNVTENFKYIDNYRKNKGHKDVLVFCSLYYWH